MTSFVNPPLLGAMAFDEAEVSAAARVVASRELFRYSADRPSESDHFERELAAWSGAAGTVVVSSGTAGLRAALSGVGVGPGDEVLVSALTFIASASAVASLGAVPVPLELGDRLDVDLEDLDTKLERVAAIVPVYVSGHTSNVDEVVAIAHEAGVAVVEDACQATGVLVGGRRAGVVGDIGVYSFQQGKQITAGEGGALVADDRDLLEACRRFTDHGAARRGDGSPWWPDDAIEIGENLRITEVQSAILRVQLSRVDTLISRQRLSRSRVDAVLREAGAFVVDSCAPGADSGSHLAILFPTKGAAVEAQRCAASHHLVLRSFWGRTFTDYPAFRSVADGASTPRALDWATRLMALPVPPLDDEGATRLLEAAAAFAHDRRSAWN